MCRLGSKGSRLTKKGRGIEFRLSLKGSNLRLDTVRSGVWKDIQTDAEISI